MPVPARIRPNSLCTLATLVAVLCLAAPANAQRDSGGGAKTSPEFLMPDIGASLVDAGLDSGFVANATDARTVIYADIVEAPGTGWIRLVFDQALLGAAPQDGVNTLLRITSLLDGAVQTMNAAHLRQWRRTSAYFNGDTVRLEIIADPQAQPSRVAVKQVIVGDAPLAFRDKSICGSTDDRVLSSDPRSARGLPAGCTAWLIDGINNGARPGCLLSAGHCFASAPMDVVEFNVPLSGTGGTIRHPPPADQYAIDPDSLQFTPGPHVGNDWSFFACFPNSTTGLTALEAQGDAYTLTDIAPAASNQTVEIVGYGTTSDPVSPTWNQVEKVHQGALATHPGTILSYAVDTTGGNSGSAIEVLADRSTIGIHTNGGCSETVGSTNTGTAIENLGLQSALHVPHGIGWRCTGIDSDGSGGVDVTDLLDLLADWGACGGTCRVDSNFDGQADIIDLLALLGQWGDCGPGDAGPYIPQAPVNDDCADAIPIAAGVTEFDTTWASTDGPSHLSCATGADGGITVNDIWFTVTAPFDGFLDVSTCGNASYDTDLVVYSGDCNMLQLLGCNDDATNEPCGNSPLWQSHVTDIPVQRGRWYLIRVGGWADAATDAGPGLLTVTFLP